MILQQTIVTAVRYFNIWSYKEEFVLFIKLLKIRKSIILLHDSLFAELAKIEGSGLSVRLERPINAKSWSDQSVTSIFKKSL